VGDVFTRWSLEVLPGGALELASDQVASPPRAVRSSVVPIAADYRFAALKRPLAGVVSHARLSYALYIEERPASSEYELNNLRFTQGSTLSEFFVAIRSSNAFIVEQNNAVDGGYASVYTDLGAALLAGQWRNVSIEVDLSASRTIAVTIDGAEIARRPLLYNSPGVPTLAAGITYAGKGAERGKILVDNLVFEILP
jgi:hypothetical protein